MPLGGFRIEPAFRVDHVGYFWSGAKQKCVSWRILGNSFLVERRATHVFSFLAQRGIWGRRRCSIKSGQPLSKKGDFELGCRLGLSTWVGCICPSNRRTHVESSSKWSTLEPGTSETSERSRLGKVLPQCIRHNNHSTITPPPQSTIRTWWHTCDFPSPWLADF